MATLPWSLSLEFTIGRGGAVSQLRAESGCLGTNSGSTVYEPCGTGQANYLVISGAFHKGLHLELAPFISLFMQVLPRLHPLLTPLTLPRLK